MVRLKRLPCPLHWGWYVVVNRLLIASIRHMSWKSRAANCPPSSESRSAGGAYTGTQCPTNSRAITAAVILFKGTDEQASRSRP